MGPIRLLWNPTDSEYIYVMIPLITKNSLPDLVCVNTTPNHHIQMQMYNSNCTFLTYLFDHATSHCLVFAPDPLDVYESIENIPTESFKDTPLEADF